MSKKVIHARNNHQANIRLETIEGIDAIKLRIRQDTPIDAVTFDRERAAELWPIIKLYAETGKIEKARYDVEFDPEGLFMVRSATGKIVQIFRTKKAARLVCDALNVANRMESDDD